MCIYWWWLKCVFFLTSKPPLPKSVWKRRRPYVLEVEGRLARHYSVSMTGYPFTMVTWKLYAILYHPVSVWYYTASVKLLTGKWGCQWQWGWLPASDGMWALCPSVPDRLCDDIKHGWKAGDPDYCPDCDGDRRNNYSVSSIIIIIELEPTIYCDRYAIYWCFIHCWWCSRREGNAAVSSVGRPQLLFPWAL